VLGALPLAAYAILVLFRRYTDRSLIKANSSTILLHLVVGLLLIAGLVFSSGLPGIFG
jgi:hypothetical protein